MWRNEIVRTLFFDVMPLKRKGMTFTWKSLDYLRGELVKATVYACGDEDAVRALLPAGEDAPRPSLFDAEKRVRPLPQADMLFEYTAGGGGRRAALATDRRRSGVELFVFRFDERRGRWIWPLMDMRYGPTFDENAQMAIYEPAVLCAMSEASRAAMVREHTLDAGFVTACLELVRDGRLTPEGEAGESAEALAAGRKPKTASPTPPSMARARRTRHRKTGAGSKGARRS
ncbi:MAG: hypothetical protein K6F46_06755 [Desulfovibrio sp.]|nr:hypothetical protein [Desulfovibrio sp.]